MLKDKLSYSTTPLSSMYVAADVKMLQQNLLQTTQRITSLLKVPRL
jgi:hypothetical protein